MNPLSENAIKARLRNLANLQGKSVNESSLSALIIYELIRRGYHKTYSQGQKLPYQ